MTLTAAVAALAAGDFSALAAACSAAGLTVATPAAGVVHIRPQLGGAAGGRLSVLLSVGVHGDETAPIELLAALLQTLSKDPLGLRVDLMLVVGNLTAIGQARRFIEADLNRLFRADQGALHSTAEAPRAAALMAATAKFFAGATGPRWHLDLHTAIRPSVYPTFAIVPNAIVSADQRVLADLLGQGGIAAVVINPTSAGTYSAFTAEQAGAISATVELGQVSQLGQNDVGVFAAMGATLASLLRTGSLPPPVPATLPVRFQVAQEIIKHSAAFRMNFGATTQNFTPLPRDSVIATDGDRVYRVGHDEEMVVFPNPEVRPGLRAGLMVVRSDW
jgi:succinylglutamate desuccinylase